MRAETSIFLDAMRFSAACVVFLSHLTGSEFNTTLPWVRWGHEAVVIFFVMSGFVIAHVVDKREQSAASYAAARLGRLYSVMLPALALTALLDPIGRLSAPELYARIPDDAPALRIAASLLFIQQSWNLTVMPLSNGPFWSLGFEFWYYVIFGAWQLTTGHTRVVVMTVGALVAGPRILAFFPLWLLGVLAYRLHQNWQPPARLQTLFFTFAALSFVSLFVLGHPASTLTSFIEGIFPDGYIDTGLLRIFAGDIPKLPADLLLGLTFAALIVFLPHYRWRSIAAKRSARAIRHLAGSTFSLYLFHVPLLYFFVAIANIQRDNATQIVLTGAAVLLSSHMLSYLGERHVATYRRLFYWLIERCVRPFKNVKPSAG